MMTKRQRENESAELTVAVTIKRVALGMHVDNANRDIQRVQEALTAAVRSHERIELAAGRPAPEPYESRWFPLTSYANGKALGHLDTQSTVDDLRAYLAQFMESAAAIGRDSAIEAFVEKWWKP